MVSAPLKTEKFGFKVKLDHVFPERRCQIIVPRLNQIWDLIFLFFRYIAYRLYFWAKRRTPVMDYFHVQNGKQIYGVPIGGIGSGTIGRGFKGEFCRYQLRPGFCQYETLHANQFIVTIKNEFNKTLYQKPLTSARPRKHVLRSWEWDFKGENGEYLGLYPRSWTNFHIPEQAIILTCRQISPIIPHNYKDSCLPAAVFVWEVENNSNEKKKISITFTFQNGIGEKNDTSPGCYSEIFRKTSNEQNVTGVLIHHQIDDMPYTFGISAKEKEGVWVSCLRDWNPLGDGEHLWEILKKDGVFPPCENVPSSKTKKGESLASAVSVQSDVLQRSCAYFEFSLVWDMPKIHFGEGNKQYWKYYTKFYGQHGNAAPEMSFYSLLNYPNWETEIEKWQKPILHDEKLPSWFKSALFNETYFVSDGGSLWIDLNEDEKQNMKKGDPRIEYGRFAYLEGHEYRMYNTYDVHFYASFALAMLWPKLQTVLQKDFCDTIPQENQSRQWHLSDGDISYRKAKNSVPHDLGDPGEEPFVKINAYPIHDVSEWRDLGIKFVLQCYRDYFLTRDLIHLKDMWNNIYLIMRNSLRWDKDADGLIENHNCADQTYDTWRMSGPSSYCGILWLAALQCTCEMAKILDDESAYSQFSDTLSRGKIALQEKLWNGLYYNFDCSSCARSRTIMSDQLCGLWYLKSCGLKNEILPEANAMKSLKLIYENNVLKYKNGTSGAVNGMTSDGEIDTYTLQSEETWTGVVYGLSALMIHQGMVDEGFHTASGIYKTVYEKIGMGFETPEALFETKSYRAIGYMRPLSIWSILLAWNMKKETSQWGEMQKV